jgi:acetoacetyl-CoA synthetase
MSVDELLAQPFGTLGEVMSEQARERAGHPALIAGGVRLSYAELNALMDRIAVALCRDGVRQGEAVAVCAATSLEYAAVFLGILRAGAVVVPLAPSSTPESLRMMLADCDAKLLFLDAGVANALAPAMAAIRAKRVALDGRGAFEAFESWLAPNGAKPAPVEIPPDQGFNIIYSSGTTGVPKGIVQPHRMRWGQLGRGGHSPESVTMISTPLYSNTTLVSFLPTLANGGTAVLMAKFEAAQFLKLSELHKATHAMLVPVQYRRLMQQPDFDAYDLSSYQMKFATSAPFSAALKAEVLRRWPGGLTEIYGMTEGGGACVLLAHEFPDKLHTVGFPMPGHEIRLIGADDREVAQGAIGEIVGRSASMMIGYHNQPDKTRESEWFSPQGIRFIRTGDVGRVDTDGFLTLLDRKKDLIISGGFNLYPSDLEAQILEHEGVLEAAVVGIASERWGETPVAFVALKPEHRIESCALKDWVNARLSKIQRLADLQVVDQLPRSHIGKVLKRELRDGYQSPAASTPLAGGVRPQAAMPAARPTPQIRRYQDWLRTNYGLIFEDYNALWRWSVTDLETFWRSIWNYDQVESPTPFEAALCVDRMPGARWFNGAQVNYARHVFRHVDAAQARGQPAMLSENELGETREIGWLELKRQVASFAVSLRSLGVRRGDRVAAYLTNGPEAVVAFLACSSLGAVWSVCAPDMGTSAVTDRFVQIEPKILIAVGTVFYAGKQLDRRAIIEQLQNALPTLRATIAVESAHAPRKLSTGPTFAEAISRADEQVAAFEPEWLPFDHPIWVLYSSGTTGLPKAIVHGQGGVLLTALASAKHGDLGASYSHDNLGERFHWYSSTGWVMWNAQISGLLSGTTICLYDGSPSGSKEHPDWGVLWRFAARHRVTFFGAGTAFYANCKKAGLRISECGDLSHIRALGSTGSPLMEDVQIWGSEQFEAIGTPDIWWYNISGGTDLCGTFCTGNRQLPQIPGEMQCRQLGAAVEAWNDAGQPVIDEVGELVCTRPIPGMPLYFWGDHDNQRFLESYFDVYPGIWRHGDWIKITPNGGCVIYGRSDATVNRFGVRMGTSEIYSAVESLPEVLDSLILDLEYLGRPSRLILFVSLRDECKLGEPVKQRIQLAIRSRLSPRFVPDDIIHAPGIPRTLSGKKQEVPMRKLFLGMPAEKAINRETMANPQCVDWYIEQAQARARPD